MPRVNISLPDELRGRIDLARADGFDMNLSAVAQKAIEAELDARELAIGPKGIAAFVDRVRDLVERYNPEAEERKAIAAGMWWARAVAHPYQLARLEAVVRRKFERQDYAQPGHPSSALWIPYAVWCDIEGTPYHELMVSRAEAFWAARLGDPEAILSTSYVYWFLGGAERTWESVKPALFATKIDFSLNGFTLHKEKGGRIVARLRPDLEHKTTS